MTIMIIRKGDCRCCLIAGCGLPAGSGFRERATFHIVLDYFNCPFRNIGGDYFENVVSFLSSLVSRLSSNQKVPRCLLERGLVHQREVAAFARDESVRHVGGLEAERATAGHGIDEGDG